MAPVAAPSVRSPQWRLTLFRVLAVLLGLVYLPGALLMAAPWAPASMAKALQPLSPLIWAWSQAANPGDKRWTFALSASVDEAIAVILVCLAWRPLARPLLFQFLAFALAVDLAANAPFVPGIIVGYSPLLLLLIAYPEPRRLLTPFWRGSINRSLLALALVTGAFFVPRSGWRCRPRSGLPMTWQFAVRQGVGQPLLKWMRAGGLMAPVRVPGGDEHRGQVFTVPRRGPRLEVPV